MGKFARLCSNPLHNTWFKGHARNVESTVVPTYKYLQAFRNIAKQNGLKSHKVRYVCRKCIEKAGMKRDFTKFLQTNSAEKISVNQSVLFHFFVTSAFAILFLPSLILVKFTQEFIFPQYILLVHQWLKPLHFYLLHVHPYYD